MLDNKYKELPSEIKLATFKELFSLISHTIKRGYIDSFGVVTGINKNGAYLTKYEVVHPVFISYFRNTLMDFDDIYNVFKESKKNIRVTYDSTGISSFVIINNNDEIVFETPIIHPEALDVYEVFRSYDNDHIFKESNHIYDIDINDFAYAITNDYIYRCNHYIITKEAVPKPKKIISGTYCISDIIEESDISYIYYTTKLVYPDIKITIASKVINLD